MERRPTVAIIDTEALKFNYLQLRKLISPETKVMAVVKANAYGHGDVEVSRVFESLGCEFFGVAIPEEGARLRDAGIKRPIVVLGGVFPGQIKTLFDYDLTPVIFDLNTASALNAHAGHVGILKKVHVKVDTGMGRLGIQPAEALPFFREMKGFARLKVEGVLSHLAEADGPETRYTKRQIEVFIKTLEAIKELGFAPELVHIGNSAAIVDYRESHLNLVRPGIMLYGSYPAKRFKEKIELRPVMQIKTRVLHLKNLPAGSSVSYGRSFVASRDSVIATLPIGYGDGLPRRLSGKGEVLIGGARAPIAGTVCMDLTMCDVTHIPDIRVGDEAIIIGRLGGEEITAEEIADKAGTISYEIFCDISGRVPRIYI